MTLPKSKSLGAMSESQTQFWPRITPDCNNPPVVLTNSTFFSLGFISQTFTIHRTAGERGGYLFNSSLPLPPTSQALGHDYCGDLTSVHS